MPKRATPSAINKALQAAGIDGVTCYRGQGYYYFMGTAAGIASIYEWPRLHGSIESYVSHVCSELERHERYRVPRDPGKPIKI